MVNLVAAGVLLVGLGGWLIRGSEIGYPRANDLRRAEDGGEKRQSMLGRYWPGPW